MFICLQLFFYIPFHANFRDIYTTTDMPHFFMGVGAGEVKEIP